jgi:energy-coupling factor transporter ATP-binding protein EcfA2
MNTTDLKSFHYLENGQITFSTLDTIKTEGTLDAGVYDISWVGYPDNRIILNISTDKEMVKMHNFPDQTKLDLLIKSFFDKKVVEKMSNLGFNHKVGILLEGKAGTGKSTIIKNYAHKIINEYNGIVFYISNPSSVMECWKFIHKIRAIQNNPIVVILEEIDMFVVDGREGYLKSAFDGNLSIDNCLIFGTTNYIDRVPSAMKNRPSRFKYVLNIEGIQCEDEVYQILDNMIGDLCTELQVQEFSRNLVGKTLDEIKQFAIDKIMDLETYKKQSSSMGFVTPKQ